MNCSDLCGTCFGENHAFYKKAFEATEQIINYYAINLVLILKMWIQNEQENYNADAIYEVYLFLISNDLQDLIENNN